MSERLEDEIDFFVVKCRLRSCLFTEIINVFLSLALLTDCIAF